MRKLILTLILVGVSTLANAAPQTAPVTAAETPKTLQRNLDPRWGFGFLVEMSRYGDLKTKVFLTEREQAEKARLLAHRGLIQGTRILLRIPSFVGSPLQALQNIAIDLLFESVQAKANAGAEDVLRDVVKDRFVERSEILDLIRKPIAGFKAEVLYRWSALQPDLAPQLESWLPGPVSQKIWRNVQVAQAQNLSEASQRR